MNSIRTVLVAVTVAGLAVDAYVHISLASAYDPVRGTVSQGQLFRIEALAAMVCALFLLLRPGRLTAAVAAALAGGGLVALVLLRYVDVGSLGPFPDMYEPLWYTKKSWTAIAQAAATAAAIALAVQGPRSTAPKGGAEQDH